MTDNSTYHVQPTTAVEETVNKSVKVILEECHHDTDLCQELGDTKDTKHVLHSVLQLSTQVNTLPVGSKDSSATVWDEVTADEQRNASSFEKQEKPVMKHPDHELSQVTDGFTHHDNIPLSCPILTNTRNELLSEKDKSFLMFLDDMRSLTTKDRGSQHEGGQPLSVAAGASPWNLPWRSDQEGNAGCLKGNTSDMPSQQIKIDSPKSASDTQNHLGLVFSPDVCSRDLPNTDTMLPYDLTGELTENPIEASLLLTALPSSYHLREQPALKTGKPGLEDTQECERISKEEEMGNISVSLDVNIQMAREREGVNLENVLDPQNLLVAVDKPKCPQTEETSLVGKEHEATEEVQSEVSFSSVVFLSQSHTDLNGTNITGKNATPSKRLSIPTHGTNDCDSDQCLEQKELCTQMAFTSSTDENKQECISSVDVNKASDIGEHQFNNTSRASAKSNREHPVQYPLSRTEFHQLEEHDVPCVEESSDEAKSARDINFEQVTSLINNTEATNVGCHLDYPDTMNCGEMLGSQQPDMQWTSCNKPAEAWTGDLCPELAVTLSEKMQPSKEQSNKVSQRVSCIDTSSHNPIQDEQYPGSPPQSTLSNRKVVEKEKMQSANYHGGFLISVKSETAEDQLVPDCNSLGPDNCCTFQQSCQTHSATEDSFYPARDETKGEHVVLLNHSFDVLQEHNSRQLMYCVWMFVHVLFCGHQ